MLDCVRDVHRGAIDSCLRQCPVEHRASRSDERMPGKIFFVAQGEEGFELMSWSVFENGTTATRVALSTHDAMTSPELLSEGRHAISDQMLQRDDFDS